ncbi:2-octaprenyl-6-methoxyphenyl hydroxylase [Pseudoalteromonas piratica]|uniref:2-octaprenyl-6-methoxyphenyl hydroxylase n=2 Tax=Pseudoalteromonas piratica TaxID=1348114 RepID=A0A0A7EH67_9GAMM|nr:2-octaprenyl-6-methoxyphenyl hydroxylase [Pseudoalteromonas piratica]
MFDIVIVGGGLTGACAALAIKQRNAALNVAVIEAFAATDESQPSFDDRSIALASESFKYLSSLGLLDANNDFTAAIKEVLVSDRGHFGKTYIHSDEYSETALGYVVEVRPWGQQLHKKMATAGITLFCPDKVSTYQQQVDSVHVTLESGEQLSAKLMLVADGAHSKSLAPLHIHTHTDDYDQVALIANIEVAKGHNNKAFERFTETGPMALLPMTKNRYSLVWCVKPEQQETLLGLPETDFVAQLQASFGYRAGIFTKVGIRAAYPLKVGRPERLMHHRVAILGNAAHLVHPIAGQGFNLGLRDVILLEKLITEATTKHRDIGDVIVLNRYQVERNQDVDTVLWLTDALVRGFSNDNRAFALTRSIVLTAMAKCKRLKAPLAKQLMGNVG